MTRGVYSAQNYRYPPPFTLYRLARNVVFDVGVTWRTDDVEAVNSPADKLL